MCEPHRHFAPLLPHTLRHIPQAVDVVATLEEGQVLAFKDGVFQYRRR